MAEIDMITRDSNGVSLSQSKSVSFNLMSKITAAKNSYVLDIALENESCTTFAASLSSMDINIFSTEQEVSLQSISGHNKPITRIKYSNENANILYSSSEDGAIRTWDLRQKGQKVQEYIDRTDGPAKGITSFDYNCDESYICAGTELIREDAFIIFWDRRTCKTLGGYWDSHTDDITQVQCHPFKRNILASGSVDGLINVFDLNQGKEDDALLHTLNTVSSVSKVMWQCQENDDFDNNKLACQTHTEEFQLWGVTEANYEFSFDRASLSKQSSVDVDYFVHTFLDEESIYLTTGSHSGNIEIWHIEDKKHNLWSSLYNGHSDTVRAAAWNKTNKMLFTGSEDGTICVWRFSQKNGEKVSKPMNKLSLKST